MNEAFAEEPAPLASAVEGAEEAYARLPETPLELLIASDWWGWLTFLLIVLLLVVTIRTLKRTSSPHAPLLLAGLCLIPLWTGFTGTVTILCEGSAQNMASYCKGYPEDTLYFALVPTGIGILLAVPLLIANLFVAAWRWQPRPRNEMTDEMPGS